MLDNKTVKNDTIDADSVPKEPAKKKHIGTNAFIGTFGTSILIQACGVIQGVIVARLLGPVGRGEYAAVIL